MKITFPIKWIALSAAIFLPFLLNSQDKKTVPNYRNTPRAEIPVEYTWKVEDIYPMLEYWKKDKAEVIQLTSKIDELKTGWTESPQKMLALFELIDKISLKFTHLDRYASLQQDVDMGNPTFMAMQGEVDNAVTNFSVKLSFLQDDIQKMKMETIQSYLKTEPRLAPYRFQMEEIHRAQKHILPEDQQKIVSMTNLFGNNFGTACGLLNNVEIPAPEITLSDGQKINLTEANFSFYRSAKNPEDRALIQKTYWENHAKFENTQAALFDGGMKYFTFNARVHNFNTGLESELFQDNIDTSVYHQLIRSTRANLAPLHRYFKLKQQLLGLKKIHFSDIYTSAIKSVDRVFTFDEAAKILLEATKPLGTDYTNLLKTALTNRWIDIYPNKNKQTGAYSGGTYGVHAYVKMNYNGTYSDLSTLAHELGHAMHSELSSRAQPLVTSQYTIFLAEIASMFNENLLTDYMLKNETDDLMKLYLIDQYLDRMQSTIYRQTYFAEFEFAMHTQAEQGNTLTAEWLNKTYLDIIRTYYGHDKDVMIVDDYLQNAWSQIPHFFRNYYVYKYSTSQIGSLVLTGNVLNGGEKERDRYLNLLKAGGSDYPMKLLQEAGVDLTSPEPAKAAFKRFDDLVTEMETLVARLKAEGKI